MVPLVARRGTPVGRRVAARTLPRARLPPGSGIGPGSVTWIGPRPARAPGGGLVGGLVGGLFSPRKSGRGRGTGSFSGG